MAQASHQPDHARRRRLDRSPTSGVVGQALSWLRALAGGSGLLGRALGCGLLRRSRLLGGSGLLAGRPSWRRPSSRAFLAGSLLRRGRLGGSAFFAGAAFLAGAAFAGRLLRRSRLGGAAFAREPPSWRPPSWPEPPWSPTALVAALVAVAAFCFALCAPSSRRPWPGRFCGRRRLGVAALAVPAAARPATAALGSERGFLTTSLNAEPARNLGDHGLLDLTEAPVRGLRPVRAARAACSKVPKPVMATLPPLATSRMITSTTAVRASLAALRLPSRDSSSLISSALFTASPPQGWWCRTPLVRRGGRPSHCPTWVRR